MNKSIAIIIIIVLLFTWMWYSTTDVDGIVEVMVVGTVEIVVIDVVITLGGIIVIELFKVFIIELKLSIGLVKLTNFTSCKETYELFANMALSALLFAINVVLYIVRFEDVADKPLPYSKQFSIVTFL